LQREESRLSIRTLFVILIYTSARYRDVSDLTQSVNQDEKIMKHTIDIPYQEIKGM
jgi:hypothetical protein